MLTTKKSKFSVLWEWHEAAAIPKGALEARFLIGETPTGKQARDVEPAGQTSDQKAEEIAKKILDSDLEKTIIEDLKRTVSKFFTHQQTDSRKRQISKPWTAISTNSKRDRATSSQTLFDSKIRGA